MHILNLIQCTDLGGMEQSALRILVGLKGRGHSCTVVSTNPIGRLGPLLKERDIPHEGVPFLGRAGWRSHFQLRAAVRRHHADAAIMTGPTLTGMLCLEKARKPRQVLNVQYHHGGEKSNWSWRTLYKLAMARFGAIAFVSDFIRKEAEAIHPPVARIAHTVRNPILMPRPIDDAARANAKQALGLPPHASVVGNAGWLIPRKRFDVFLRVAARIRAAIPDASFVIAGDGPERTNLEALAAELGIAPAVRWLGWQPALDSLYAALDLLVFSTDWDAFPTTPLEAMSHGIPVVASSEHGGLAETLAEPRFGVLLPEHDDARLGEAAIALLREPERARELGRAGRDRVANLCNIDKTVDAYERLLSNAESAGR